jgi:hypothetical protein
VQVHVDGGDNCVTAAVLNGSISNNVLTSQRVVLDKAFVQSTSCR